MEKITIQYFLNKDLNPQILGRIKKYPVYVQVITLRKNLRFKSNNTNFEYLSDEELANHSIQSLFNKEKEVLHNIVRDLIDNNKRDLITSRNLSLYSKRIYDVIEYNFCKLLIKESKEHRKFLPGLFYSATYSEINQVILFYNDESPLSDISNNIHHCLNAFQVLYTQSLEGIEKYYLYDLYEGVKRKDIIDEFAQYAGDDTEEIENMLSAIKELASL